MPESPEKPPLAAAVPEERRSFGDIDFRYRPMVTVPTHLVSTFIVLPIREAGPARYHSGYNALAGVRDSAEILEFDQMTLERAASELRRLVAAGGRSVFVVPVNFETLANPRRVRGFARLCADRLAGIQKRIAFEIIGLPDHVPAAQLADLVAALSPCSRAFMVRFPSDCAEFTAYRSVGLHAVGIDIYHSPKNERTLMEEMDRFTEGARKSRFKSYVMGIGSLSLLTSAVSSGFDYLSGHALGSISMRAEDIKAFYLNDLYGSPPAPATEPRQTGDYPAIP